MQEGKITVPYMTIYVTEEQRERMKKLAEQLDANGVKLRDNRGTPSISALIRHLVDQEQKRLAAIAAQQAAANGEAGTS